MMRRTITNRPTIEENNKITDNREFDQILEERIYATLDRMIIRLLLRRQNKDQSLKMTTKRNQMRNQLNNRDHNENRDRCNNKLKMILTRMMKKIAVVMTERKTKIAMKKTMKNQILMRKKHNLLNIKDFTVTSILKQTATLVN